MGAQNRWTIAFIIGHFLTYGFPNLWFARESPFTTTTQIMKTTEATNTSQTAKNKGLSAGLAASTETKATTKTTGIQGAANHGFPNQRV